MKYILNLVVFTFLASMVFSCQCFAAEMNVVKAKKCSVGPNSEVRIPITIENNEGIIGFRITIKYDETKISITDVQKGDVTANGLFNNNINMEQGTFDVLWSYTEDVTVNGTLFEIVAKTTPSLNDDIILEISYSQEDTFDEEMNDVVLCCEDAILTFDEKEKDIVLQNDNQVSVDVKEYVDNAICDVDEEQIVTTIENTLKEHDVDDIENISEEALETISDGIVEDLEKKGVSSDNLKNKKDKAVAVKQLYKTAKSNVVTNKKNSIDVEENVEKSDTSLLKKTNTKVMIIVTIVLFVIVGVIVGVARKKVK